MKSRLFAAILSLGLIGTAQADGLSYDYFQIGYAKVDLDIAGYSLDGTGIGIEGSWSAGSNGFVTLGYSNFSMSEFGLDYDEKNLTIAYGQHMPISETADFVFRGGLLKSDADLDGYGSDSDTGFLLGAGFRNMLNDSVELYGNINYVDIYDDSGISYNAGLRFVMGESASFLIGLAKGEDTDALEAGVRFGF